MTQFSDHTTNVTSHLQSAVSEEITKLWLFQPQNLLLAAPQQIGCAKRVHVYLENAGTGWMLPR